MLTKLTEPPQPYDIQITDSITGHGSVTLSWNDTINGTFEIYTRPAAPYYRSSEEPESEKPADFKLDIDF